MHQPDDPLPQQIITREIVRDSVHGSGRMVDKLILGLVVPAILALVGVVWNQSLKSERQSVLIENQTTQLGKLETAVADLAKEVRSMRRENAGAG